MRDYVTGFLLSTSGDEVLLVRKKRPIWQAGLWNGLGGRIYSGENWARAMDRKAQDEAGVQVTWRKITAIVWNEVCVHFYAACCDRSLRRWSQKGDEELAIHHVNRLADVPVLDCLRFVLPMCAYAMTREAFNDNVVISIDGSGEDMPKVVTGWFRGGSLVEKMRIG